MACSWGRGSESRCGHRSFQTVPGNMSFRQDWPITLCPETDCEIGKSADETDTASNWGDPCDEEALSQTEPEPPGPLEQFDERVRRYLEGDVWSNAVQPPTHRPILPPVLKRAVKRVGSETEAFVTNEIEFRRFAKAMMNIEKNYQFELALKKAEEASATAPDEKIEEIALASARGFTMSMDADRETTVSPDGRTVVEVISYCGITKPHTLEENF